MDAAAKRVLSGNTSFACLQLSGQNVPDVVVYASADIEVELTPGEDEYKVRVSVQAKDNGRAVGEPSAPGRCPW